MRVGVIMDPIESINTRKDSSFAMLLEAQRRGHSIAYMTAADISLRGGTAMGRWKSLQVRDDTRSWFSYGDSGSGPLSALDCILMRKDPPFDMEYINDTYVLDRAQEQGTLVVNRPQALRDANEKLFTAWFEDLTPRCLFARDPALLKAFVAEHGHCVIKPVDGMGGTSIFQVRADDPNLNVVLETVSHNGERLIVAQKYVDAITNGDKRILVVDGDVVPYCLARIPAQGDFRGNLARGGRGEARPLSGRDREIAETVAPVLKERGILFAGLDVIGDFLTEINVTSPTCIREIDRAYDLNIAGMLFDAIEGKIAR